MSYSDLIHPSFSSNFLLITMRLYYVYDALCGWCYGFSPVIQQYAKDYPEVPITVVSGGMITGERIGPIGEVAGYISQAYKHVEDRCGVVFGQDFLEGTLREGTTVFTSVPPAIALAAFRSLRPDQQLAFAGDLQKAIYFDGVDPSDYRAYAERAIKYGVDPGEFVASCNRPEIRQAAEADFALARRWGVTGFPTVIQEKEGQLTVVARGYVDALPHP